METDGVGGGAKQRAVLLGGLAVAIAVILIAGLAAWTVHHRDHEGDEARGPSQMPTPLVTLPVTPADEPAPAPAPAPTSGPLVDVDNAAAADYLGTLELAAGQPVAFTADGATGRVYGRVTDATGADLGAGSLRLGPGPAALAAAASAIDGQVDVTPSEVVLTDASIRITRGPLTVEGKGLVFQPNQPKGQPLPPERSLGDTKVTVNEPGGMVDLGGGKRWDNAPNDLHLRDVGRATLSWAGGRGHVTGPNREAITAKQTLGVKAEGLAGTITRSPRGVAIKAEGRLRQAYADGLPRLQARGRVDVKVQPSPLKAGSKGSFTWAPTNTSEYDFAISRIRPGNDQGRWVNLALDQLPTMCGRPACERFGGNTEGLGKKGSGAFFFGGGAKAINAVIIPGTGDERDITFDVPGGTAPGSYNLVLVLEGNFDSVTVTIPVQVIA